MSTLTDVDGTGEINMPITSDEIISLLCGFLNTGHNSLHTEPQEKAWAGPLSGFSRGDDPLYAEIKSDIGSFFTGHRRIFSRLLIRSPRCPWIISRSSVGSFPKPRRRKPIGAGRESFPRRVGPDPETSARTPTSGWHVI